MATEFTRLSQTATFLRAPETTLDLLQARNVAVIGVPFDATKVSRRGTRDGPDAIREASGWHAARIGKAGIVDMERDVLISLPEPSRLVDLGNLVLFATDIHGMIESLRGAVAETVRRGAFPVALGGDHFVAYPSVLGFVEAMQEEKPAIRIGYIQVDQHLDLEDEAPGFGKYSSGTQGRRIAEMQAIGPDRMVFIGINDTAPAIHAAYARRAGITVITLDEFRRAGLEATVQRVNDRLADCDAVYVSLDIDVLDRSVAPGTGNTATFGGMEAREMLDLAAALGELPLGAVDLVEVAPNWDPSGRTPALAAAILYKILGARVFDYVRFVGIEARSTR